MSKSLTNKSPMSQLLISSKVLFLIVSLLDSSYRVIGFSHGRPCSHKGIMNSSYRIISKNQGHKNILLMSSNSDDENDIQTDFRYQERAAQISEMGGDPSFLTFDDLSDEDDEEDDSTTTENVAPSLSFMSQLESAPNTLDLIGNEKRSNKNPYGKQDLASGGAMHFLSDNDNGVTDFDLEEIGGDPSFLGMDDDEKDEGDDDWGGWDGTVDEDAHFDFY